MDEEDVPLLERSECGFDVVREMEVYFEEMAETWRGMGVRVYLSGDLTEGYSFIVHNADHFASLAARPDGGSVMSFFPEECGPTPVWLRSARETRGIMRVLVSMMRPRGRGHVRREPYFWSPEAI